MMSPGWRAPCWRSFLASCKSVVNPLALIWSACASGCRHARFARPLPLAEGFDAIEAHLAGIGRSPTAFCACELRSPAQFTDAGFVAFNRHYVERLAAWGIFRRTIWRCPGWSNGRCCRPQNHPETGECGLRKVACFMKPSLISALCAAFLLSQAHAQGLLQTQRISAELANQAVAAVVAKCASQGYAETGVLVDADGVRQAVLRGNVAGAHTLDSAFAKAYTAASFKTDTTALVERSKTVPVLANLFKLPHLLLLGGGIVIKVGDEVVGAIGAAGAPGGDLDDACAHAGLDKIKDQLK
jgi:uncharacterized protein GlcG (DUF336 family)